MVTTNYIKERKNPLAFSRKDCTYVQVDPMKQGAYPMKQALDETLSSYYRLLSKQEIADLLGVTTRTIDRMIATCQIPPEIIVKVPSGAKGGTKTRFIYGRAVAWIKSLAGPMPSVEAN